MTTLAHISANLRRIETVPVPTSLPEKSVSTNASASYAKKHPWRVTSSKMALDAKIAAEELALAALIHSELMSIRLPNVSYACLSGKTLPCRAIGGDFFDAIELTDALCAVVADVSGKG